MTRTIIMLAIMLLALGFGCANGPADQTTNPKQIVGDGATATQSTSSTQWVVHALDAARERLGMATLRIAGCAAALLLLAGIGWSLLLLNMNAPTNGRVRSALILVSVGMLASPAVVALALLWR